MPAKSINISIILILLFLSLAMLANSMTKPLGRDEQMYCTGGVMMAGGKLIYRDFSYAAQMPYHPLLYAALFKILNTTHYLLVGRIVSTVCDIGVLVCIVGIYRRIFAGFRTAGALLGMAAAILYVFNPLVDYANGYAWNHDVVILCVMLSLWLFVSIDLKSSSQYRRIAIVGALLTFASCMRITTAIVELLFFVMLAVRPGESVRAGLKRAAVFLFAAAFVASWPVWVIIQAPRAFYLNIIKIPTLYSEWLERIGMVHNKMELMFHSITTPGYLAVIVIAAYLCFVLVFLHRKSKITEGRILLFAPLLTVTFFIIAFIPPTMWQQYLAMPVPFWVISFAYPLLYLRKLPSRTNYISKNVTLSEAKGLAGPKREIPRCARNDIEMVSNHFKIAVVLIVFCVIVAIGSQSFILSRTLMLAAPEDWTPIQLHRISQEISERVKEPKLVLTLAPLFALEGGCDIYTELSAGSIIYRVGDFMTAEERAITHTIGPKTLEELVEKSPPAVVIVGVEMEFLEEHLFKTAVKPDWERKVYENGVVAYFRP
jgi:hypothetical protein